MRARAQDQVSRKQIPNPGEAKKLARIAELEAAIKKHKEELVRKAAAILPQPDPSDSSLGAFPDRFVDSNILPMMRCNIYGDIYEANDAAARLLGYSRQDLSSGKVRWSEITPPEYNDLDLRAIDELRATGRSKPWEKEYICNDGSRKHIFIAVITANVEGDCYAFFVDRSEQKRLQAEAQKSEERFRRLAEAMPDIVWMAEPDGRTTYHNQRFYDYTGIEPDDDDGWIWTDHVAPEDRAPLMERVRLARESGSSFQFEFRYRSRHGHNRWHLCRGLPLIDAQGNVLKFFGTCTDIDKSKSMEEELRESEAHFHTMANAIPQIVWTAGADGSIDFFNDRWFEYTGLTYEQSADDGWLLLIHPDDRQRYQEGWRQALDSGDSYEAEFRLRRAAGLGKRIKDPYRWHLCRAVALCGANGGATRWFATWTEIEDQKRRR